MLSSTLCQINQRGCQQSATVNMHVKSNQIDGNSKDLIVGVCFLPIINMEM